VLRRPIEFTQFTSWAFSELIGTKGLIGSMGTVGDCYDNAPMESFWGTMQIELLNRKKWRTKIELSIAIAEWIEHFYNPERLHSSLGYLPPIEFEALHSFQTQT
jgi:putative transposase